MKRSFKTVRVRDVMTTTLVTVSPEDSLQHALDLLDKYQVHELPVVAPQGRLIGIVTAGDLKLMTPVFPLVPDQQEIRQTLRDLKVAGAMTIEPVVISPDATLLSAAKELLERFGLTDRSHHVPSQLSTGERQRTALARALLASPQLILADEPTGNLDRENADSVLESLAEFSRGGGAVLMVTHDPSAVARADRTLTLQAGRLVTVAETSQTR